MELAVEVIVLFVIVCLLFIVQAVQWQLWRAERYRQDRVESLLIEIRDLLKLKE